VNVASSGAVTDAAIADSSGNTAFDNATLAAARSKTYPLNEGTGFKPVRPNGADLSWNATHGYSRFSKCSPLPDEYVWTATFKPAGSPILGH
jgi:TonB family protein